MMTTKELNELCIADETHINEKWLIKNNFMFTTKYMLVAFNNGDIDFAQYGTMGRSWFDVMSPPPSYLMVVNGIPMGKVRTTKDVTELLNNITTQ